MPAPVQHSSENDALCSHLSPQYCQGGYQDSLAGSAAHVHSLLRDVHYPGPGGFGLNKSASSVGVARTVIPLRCSPIFVWSSQVDSFLTACLRGTTPSAPRASLAGPPPSIVGKVPSWIVGSQSPLA